MWQFNLDVDRFSIDEERGNIGAWLLAALSFAVDDVVSLNLFLPQREQQVQALHWSICLLLALMFQDVMLLGWAAPTPLLVILLNELL